MRSHGFALGLAALFVAVTAWSQGIVRTDAPVVGPDLVFKEVDGLLIIEAECFFAQSNSVKRAWHLTSAAHRPQVGRDIDDPHFADASGGAYIEVLPDTGNDPVGPVAGESISDKPGEMAVAAYRAHFNTPGRYYIWARAFGTDGDDNTLHFGLDGQWPTNSARMHTFGGKKWLWACRHRQHKGKIYLDIPSAGAHTITISMREDGCELDRFILTRDEQFTPPDSAGPPAKLKSGSSPSFGSIGKPGSERPPASPQTQPAVLQEREGLLVVEVESLGAADGWKPGSTAAGFTGNGYLEWTLPGQGRKAGEGLLTCSFQIRTPGNYQFLLRSRMPDPKNRPDTLDPDGNDTWLRFNGGTDVPGQAALGDGWKKIAILGHPENWTWNTQADPGPPHPLTPVCRAFPAGVFCVEFSGRSFGHALDRSVLRRYDSAPVKALKPAEEMALDRLSVSAPE